MAVYRARCLCSQGSIRRWITTLVGIASLAYTSAWASAQAGHQAAAHAATAPVPAKVPRGPIDFRCDSLEVASKPVHRQTCRTHVIVRQDDLLLCCTTLTGESDAQWGLTRLACTGDVRVTRGIETIWATKGVYDVATGEVVLTGAPMLDRAGSRMTGSQITVSLSGQYARVQAPQGQLVQPDSAPAATGALPGLTPPKATIGAGPLPAVCPIAPRPRGSL